MVKTVNVNIGGYPFTLDEGAYAILRDYINQIESRLSAREKQGVMEDVENRIADIFSQKLSVRRQVVSVAMVYEVISVIGQADEFGEPQAEQSSDKTNEEPKKKEAFGSSFRRSSSDKMIAGICGGLAPILKIDPALLRVIVLLAMLLSGSIIFWVYIIFWIVTPLDTENENKQNDEDR